MMGSVAICGVSKPQENNIQKSVSPHSHSPNGILAAATVVDSFNLGFMNEAASFETKELFSRGIDELSQFTPEEQYNFVYKQVSKQCGWIFEDKNDSISSPKIPDMNFKVLQIENHPPIANVVGYVVSQFNSLIEQRQQRNKQNKGGGRVRSLSLNSISTSMIKKKEIENVNLDLLKLGFRNVNCTIEKSVLTSDAHKKIREKSLVLVEAGSLVGDINDYYWPKNKRNSLCDENGDAYNVLASGCTTARIPILKLASIGAIANQCNVGAIKSFVESIELITIKNGKLSLYQIEPTNGIHDKNWGARVLETQHIKLIQNDQVFNDVLMSMYSGCYGVVTRIYVKMENAYYVKAHSEKVLFKNWENKFDEIVNGEVCDLKIKCNPYQAALESTHKDNNGGKDNNNNNNDDTANTSMVFEWWVKDTKDEKEKEKEKQADKATEKQTEKEKDSESLDDEKQTVNKENDTLRLNLQEMKIAGYTAQVLASVGLYEAVSIGINGELNREILTDKFKNIGDGDGGCVPCVVAFDSRQENIDAKRIGGNMFLVNETKKIVNGYVNFLNKKAKSLNNQMIVTSPFVIQLRRHSNEFELCWIEQGLSAIGKEHMLTNAGYETSLKNANKLLNESKKWFDKNTESKIRVNKYISGNEKEMRKDYSWWKQISNANKASFIKNYKKFDKDNFFENDLTLNFSN